MAASGVKNEFGPVSEDEARFEASRLMSDESFHVSDRHRAFLRYIIDAMFEGRGESVKAYTIAVDVFNRPVSFDAASDPIVRIEATRLRESLDKYYELLPPEIPVRLEIPRGRYLPHYTRRAEPANLERQSEHDATTIESNPVGLTEAIGRVGWAPRLGMGIAATVFALTAVYAGYALLFPAVAVTGRPILELSIDSVDGHSAGAVDFMNQLSMSVGRFGSARTRLRNGSDPAPVLPKAVHDGLYRLALRYSETPTSVALWWQVTDYDNGEALATGDDGRVKGADGRDSALRALAYGISRRIAGPFGVVNTMELNRKLPTGTLGNICILRGDIAVERRDMVAVKASVPCLEATLSAAPNDADALASLARVMAWAGRTDRNAAMLSRAQDLANQAAMQAPQSASAARAQMATRYLAGQMEGAISAARRGLTLNPENAELQAKLAIILFLDGQWDKGRRVAEQAVELAGEPLRDTSFVLIFDAYRRGEFREAISLSAQASALDAPTAALKLAAIARLGDRDVTEDEVALARAQHPDLDQAVGAMLSGRRYDKGLEASLRIGLEQAGLVAAR